MNIQVRRCYHNNVQCNFQRLQALSGQIPGKRGPGPCIYEAISCTDKPKALKVTLFTILICCSSKKGFRHLLAHLSRRLRGELLVYQWLWRPSSVVCRPSSVVRPSVNIFKHLLLWNHWANWTQISYGDSLTWGNKSLFKCSWSHDKDGRHAHIW